MKYYSAQGNALPQSLHPGQTIEDFVRAYKPAQPLYSVDLPAITKTAQNFCAAFKGGTTLFAVKTNPDSKILHAAARGGISAFDVASLEEIKLVHAAVPSAQMHFMHPVKAPEAIHAAYHEYGVRHFVLDHEDELFKIMRETDLAQDLNLTVRLSLPHNESAAIDLSSKFGAPFNNAIELLQKCRPISQCLSLSFHVGTQNTDPARYGFAVAHAAQVIEAAGVPIDALNIGGGFPAPYADQPTVPSFKRCLKQARQAIEAYALQDLELLAEPGRVITAHAAKLITRVELRKKNTLYINDGVYGGLFDAADWIKTKFPVSAVSCDRPFDGPTQDYTLAGPTCDSIDMLAGTFSLPNDIGMGDWIIVSQIGAYSQSMRTNFNGFGAAHYVYKEA